MQNWTIDNRTILVTRKQIKNIYLRVYPSDGSIRVSAPKQMSRDSIADFVRKNSSWIDRTLEKRARKAVPQVTYESDSLVPLWGQATLLKVVEETESSGRKRCAFKDDCLVVTVPAGTDVEGRQKAVENFLRREIKPQIADFIAKYEPEMGVKVKEFGVKKMKTRWGTCNYGVGRIWLNLELAKKDPAFLEYVVVHEMAHLLEPSHNHRFKSIMDRFYPSWREVRKALNDRSSR